MGLYHNFRLTSRRGSAPEIHGKPPVGAVSAFALDLLAEMDQHVSTDPDGRLVLYVQERSLVGTGRPLVPSSLVFEPVRFDPGNVIGGPPKMLVCRRVA